MTILDRMLFLSFVRAFAICIASTLSLYIIVDLFTNLDSFASKSEGMLAFLRRIGNYYGYRVIEYTDRLAEVITLLAAMFTIAWMQRSNEILPLLSAGVSMKRILRPILVGSSLLIGLATLNSEFVLPEISDELMLDRDDPQGTKKTLVQSAYDANGVQMEGLWGNRIDKSVEYLYVTLPETATSRMIHLSAANARYIPKGTDKLSGGWLLTDTTPRELDPANRPEMVEMLDPGRFFVRTKTIEFDTLTRHPKWFMYASTSKINQLLKESDGRRQNNLAVTFHMRLTRPLLGIILVVMGLSIILRDQTRNVFISTGLCLAMCAVFYGAVFACRFLGTADYLPPALAAWLPVMIFGALAFAWYDAIHT